MAANDRQWQGGNGFQNYSMTGAGGGGGAGSSSNASTPSRPARSVRRPARDVPPLNVKSSSGAGASSSGQLEPPRMRHANSNDSSASGSRAARLAQAIQKDEREREAANGYRPGSSLSFRSASPDADEADFFGGEPLIVPTASTSKVDRDDTSPVLAKAVAAFSSAGQAKGKSQAATAVSLAKRAARDRAATYASNKSAESAADNAGGPRSRRGAVGVQGESARRRATQHPQAGVPSTPAFREMERVLALVATEWPELLPPPIDEDAGEEEQEDTFDPVTLALSLVNEEGSTERFDSFMAAKQALSRSLQSSIQTHYRAFDASASSYNGLVLNLTHAQKNTTDLRKVLEEVRETLGKRRTDLAVLEARRTELAEMDRILVTIDTLKSIPDRLESLLSDKQFLQAASLLMRSLRMINRADMMEISATADLRAYFVSQENLMYEYLTEELHSHLYLKSLYTESRWRAHTPQQTALPIVYVEHSTRSIFDAASTDLAASAEESSQRRPTRLAAFLVQLSQKPSFVRNIDETIDESFIQEATKSSTQIEQKGELAAGTTMPKSGSLASIQSAAGNVASVNGAGLNGYVESGDRNKANPEQDSFTYIESILESLAYLGKLGVALDGVLQRNPLEIYNLVESTAIEVDDRNDPIRRSSLRIAGIGNSSKFLLNGASQSQNSTAYSFLLRSTMSSTSLSLDDASATSGIIDMNTEILLDFFWTLFSKLDAVLQGFRVFHEVVQRIVKSKDFAESALVSKSGGLLFTLNDIWRPIQFEVQALLHDYLIDEQSDGISSRSQVASVNDVLRQGRLVRDPRKSLFKFGESDSKGTSRRIRPYEDSLNKALKTSVPGLVSSLAEGSSAGIGLSTSSAAFSSNLDSLNSASTNGNGSGNIVGRTHRMLVPPNGFKIDCLALPALKFLERAKICLNEADGIDSSDTDIAKRCSGLMDEATLDRLRPALSEHVKLTSNGNSNNDFYPNSNNDNSKQLTNGNVNGSSTTVAY